MQKWQQQFVIFFYFQNQNCSPTFSISTHLILFTPKLQLLIKNYYKKRWLNKTSLAKGNNDVEFIETVDICKRFKRVKSRNLWKVRLYRTFRLIILIVKLILIFIYNFLLVSHSLKSCQVNLPLSPFSLSVSSAGTVLVLI